MPRRQQSQNMATISKSYILTPHHPQGHGMSVKCAEPIDELTVQVWSLYDHPNFKYCTLFVSGAELRTDGQTNGRTDGRSDHQMPPADFSGRGHKKGAPPFRKFWIRHCEVTYISIKYVQGLTYRLASSP